METDNETIDRDKMEELLYAIQHTAHVEEHLLELYEKNFTKDDLSDFIKRSRDTRRVLMDELITMFEHNGVGAIWCVLKHALLAHFHLLELYEKDYERVYIEEARKVYLMINDLLKHEYKNYSNCARCDGDKEHDTGNDMDDKIPKYLTEKLLDFEDSEQLDFIEECLQRR